MQQIETQSGSVRQRARLFGTILLLLAALAMVTGIALVPFYRPSAGSAHRSIQAIQASPVLAFLRNAHHWLSALLIVLGGLYLLYNVFTSSYRRPLHPVWIASVGMVLLFLLFQLTGHLLPWDVRAVRTAAIETGIAANAPLVGKLQARLLRGGEEVGPHTLSVWYAAHAVLLPLALIALAGVYIAQARLKRGDIRSLKAVITATLVGISLLAALVPAPLGPAATPADYTSYDTPPEWYVLPLHSLLTIFQRIHPDLAFVGTMVIPGAALLLLLALPWLDRRSQGLPQTRWVQGALAAGALGFVILVGMSMGNVASPIEEGATAEPAQATQIQPKAPSLDPQQIAAGKTILSQNGCLSCHQIGGQGGAAGPPLNGEGLRHPDLDWQIRHLKAPSDVVNGSTMPSYGQLSDRDLRSLATYLLSLK